MTLGIVSGSAKGAKKVVHLYKPSTWKAKNWLWRIGLILFTLVVINIVLMLLWSREPQSLSAQQVIASYTDNTATTSATSEAELKSIKTGVALTMMTIHIMESLQSKSGGYVSNDVLPPGVLLDNIENWEYGVLRNLRDLSKIYRNYFSTSGSQTEHDKDLVAIENKLSIDSTSWMLPSSESAYKDATKAMKRYLQRISDEDLYNAQFYARADNLKEFLNVVSTNLGSLSQRLGASVGNAREDTSLAGDKNAEQTTKRPAQLFKQTAWHKIDDNFYEARGYAWALLQELRAIQIDFGSVIEDKNASAYVAQIIRELEATQKGVWSPIILNGDGFGLVTNHSLVMASYISRANAAVIDLVNLLERG